MDDQVVDLIKDGLDMVLIIGALSDSNLVVRKLSTCLSVLCGSPSYFKKYDKPKILKDLKQHNCLYYSYLKTGIEWVFDGPSGPERIKPEGNIQINNSTVLKKLMLDNVGICQMPLFIVEPELSSGALVTTLEQYRLPEHGIYAVYPQRAFIPAKLKVFIDYLEEKLERKSQIW
jgi:DNA-binding transcriptional LysR family regulator